MSDSDPLELAPRRAFDPSAVETWVRRSLSPATRRAYAGVVRDFARFIRRPVVEATAADVVRWRDALLGAGKKPSTVAHRLAALRSLFRYLQADGYVIRNPAASELAPPPTVPDDLPGRALSPRQVRHLLAGPDRATSEGARDYALLLLLARTGLRVAEACALTVGSVGRTRDRWVLTVHVKGGRERVLPLPDDVRLAFDRYVALDGVRRGLAHSVGPDGALFQPIANHRTLDHGKALGARQARNIVAKWASYAGIGALSPHDLRRTFITLARAQGLSNHQIQDATGHRDARMLERYDRARGSLDRNAINFLTFDDAPDG